MDDNVEGSGEIKLKAGDMARNLYAGTKWFGMCGTIKSIRKDGLIIWEPDAKVTDGTKLVGSTVTYPKYLVPIVYSNTHNYRID